MFGDKKICHSSNKFNKISILLTVIQCLNNVILDSKIIIQNFLCDFSSNNMTGLNILFILLQLLNSNFDEYNKFH